MMRVAKDRAVLSLSRRLYARASLEAAALALGARARVFLEAKGDLHAVTLRPARRLAAPRLAALAGEFLNHALSHAYRQRVLRAEGDLPAALMGLFLERGFAAAPADPLEELEPQVAEDRRGETEALLKEAAKP